VAACRVGQASLGMHLVQSGARDLAGVSRHQAFQPYSPFLCPYRANQWLQLAKGRKRADSQGGRKLKLVWYHVIELTNPHNMQILIFPQVSHHFQKFLISVLDNGKVLQTAYLSIICKHKISFSSL